MKTPLTFQELNSLRKQGKTFQEIANLCGCSRQYIHQVLSNPPQSKQPKAKAKAPTKAELYAQVEALTRENINLQERLDAEKRERWNANKDRAFSMFYRLTPFLPKDIYGLTLEHIDASGYWFSFKPINDKAKQTFCVRHTDL